MRKIKNKKMAMAAIMAVFLLLLAPCLTACSAASAAKAADAKKEQVSPKEIPVSNDTTLKNDFFKVDNNEMTNMFGRLIKPSSVGVSDTAESNVLPSDPQQAAWLDLQMAAKSPAAMEGMIRNILHEKVPENLTVKIDGVEYMSREAQALWYKYYYLLKPQIEKNEVKVKTLSEGTKAYTDGVNKDGSYIVSSQLQDLSNQKTLAFKDAKGGNVEKLLFCANIVLEEQPKDVPRGDNKIPKAPPTPKEPPTPGTSAKKIDEAPQRNSAVVAADTNNVRPGATGNENATVDSSPGTSYQGNDESAVAKAAAEAQAQAEAQAAAQAAAQAKAAAEHQAAQKAADNALAAEKAAAAQAAQDAAAAQAAAEAAQRATNQQKAQTQTNNGVVSGDDDW
jgi:hypothetical protein